MSFARQKILEVFHLKKGQLTREIILDQAVTLAGEKGLNNLTYNGLARAVGIQPQSMYRYVTNIADVKGGVVATYVSHLVTYLYHELLPYSGKDALIQLALKFVSFTQSGLSFNDMVWGISAFGDDPQVAEQMTALHDLSEKLITGITTDQDQVKANTALFLEFIIGHLGLMTASSRPVDQELFEPNVERVLDLM